VDPPPHNTSFKLVLKNSFNFHMYLEPTNHEMNAFDLDKYLLVRELIRFLPVVDILATMPACLLIYN
jgi:hypothetical protein